MKEIFSGTILAMLLIGMLTLAYDIPTVKADVRTVGVKVGDWAKYDIAFSWTGTYQPVYEDIKNIEWLMIEVTSISGTKITYDGIIHYKNGTEINETGFMWDVNPSWIYLHTFHWFIGAELEVDDIIYPSSGWSGKINETEIRTYAGAPREVNRFNGTVLQYSYLSFIDCYWDKETGILAEQYIEQHWLDNQTESVTFYFVMVQTNVWSPTYIPVEVNVTPKSLNLRSKGEWITAYIELPEGYDVNDINVSSILLNGTVPANPNVPTEIGDYDSDGIPDLMVKFNRAEVIAYILNNIDMEDRFGTITLTASGYLDDGTPFEGTDTIKIIYNERLVTQMLRYQAFMQSL